jgi:enoyl-CoA hydratase/carnithine racemase
MGLLNRVVKKDQLYPVVNELAESLAAKNPTAVMGSKAIVNAVAAGQAAVMPELLLDRP